MTPSQDQSSGLDVQSVDTDSDYPPPDDLFRALANSKRRRLLAALPASSSISLDELTDLLVGWQTTSDGPVGPDEWAQVKIELVHAHLPLLADSGLISYEDEEIERAQFPSPVGDLITFAGEYEEVTATDGPG